MTSTSPRPWLASAGLALLCTACAALHPPPRASAELRQSAPIVAPAGEADGNWPQAQWWKSYGDDTLDTLIDTAIGTVPSIAGADARIRAAQEDVRIAGAALGLTVDATGAFTRQRLSDNGMIPPTFLGFHWYDQSDLGVAVRYQFDWWGKQHAAVEAAVDRVRATAAERQAAALGLAAAVSDAYFTWQADDAQVALQQQTVTLHEQLLNIARARQAADLESADVALDARRQLAAQREQLAMMQGARQLDVVNLAGLLGVDAAALPALTERPLPAINASLPQDAGTNLLARRPDIQASRWRVEAALRDTDAARASFYPDISLHALAGLSSIDIGKLLETGSRAPQLGIAFDLPLFDAGLRRARHGAAMAGLDIAIAAYDDAVVNAARQTGAAAAALEQAGQQREQREQQLAAAHALSVAAEARARSELTHEGPALTAQAAELGEQQQLLRVELATVLADVQLKQALAGNPAPSEEKP
ncbi:MAG TPA: efflux transporter outer membrane subunit [Steroidobacteraceae bacterium]|nr:efflux transporter outer membrane subunit [Steroidobacteraceae bacterium]